jgi:hypothetical protein
LVDAPVSNPHVLFPVPFLLINRPPQFTCQSANCFSFSPKSQKSKNKKAIHIHGCITGNSVGHQNFLSPRVFLRSFSLRFFPSHPGPGLADNTEVSSHQDRSIAKRDRAAKVHLPAHLRYTSLRIRHSRRDVLHSIPCEYVALHPKEPLPISDLLSSLSNGRRIIQRFCSSPLVSVIKSLPSGVYSVLLCFVTISPASRKRKRKKKTESHQAVITPNLPLSTWIAQFIPTFFLYM